MKRRFYVDHLYESIGVVFSGVPTDTKEFADRIQARVGSGDIERLRSRVADEVAQLERLVSSTKGEKP